MGVVNLERWDKTEQVDRVFADAQGGLKGVTEVRSVRDSLAAHVADVCGERLVSVSFHSYYTSDAGVADLAGGCPLLSTVDLTNCTQVTDAGIAAVAGGCPLLTDINLTNCTQITDAGVAVLAGGCPSLTSINLTNCTQITDAGIAALAGGCPSLTIVGLTNCTQITDAGLAALVGGCPSLTTVNLQSCTQVTNAGLAALVGGCPLLSSISLYNCTQVTDSGVAVLAGGCPSLTSINLTNCTQITDAGVAALAGGCPLLSSVNITNCIYVSDYGVAALAQTRSHLLSLKLNNSGVSAATNVNAASQVSLSLPDAVVGSLLESAGSSIALHVFLRIQPIDNTVLQLAVDAGADLSSTFRDGHSLFHSHACSPRPSPRTIALLIGADADPFVLDDEGKLPYALRPKSAPPAFVLPLLDWLRTHGDGEEEVVDGVNKATITLFVALRAADTVPFSVPTLAFLINAGADLEGLEPVLGERPLHIAASHGRPHLVMALLAAGVDPWSLNAHGAAAYVDVTELDQTTNTQNTISLLMGATPVPPPFAAHVQSQIEAGGNLAGPSSANQPSRIAKLEEELEATKAELSSTKTELSLSVARIAAVEDKLATVLDSVDS